VPSLRRLQSSQQTWKYPLLLQALAGLQAASGEAFSDVATSQQHAGVVADCPQVRHHQPPDPVRDCQWPVPPGASCAPAPIVHDSLPLQPFHNTGWLISCSITQATAGRRASRCLGLHVQWPH
jgi:hypothetical protein